MVRNNWHSEVLDALQGVKLWRGMVARSQIALAQKHCSNNISQQVLTVDTSITKLIRGWFLHMV